MKNRIECPECDGKGSIHKLGIGGSWNPMGTKSECDECGGLGWINDSKPESKKKGKARSKHAVKR